MCDTALKTNIVLYVLIKWAKPDYTGTFL